MAAPPTTTAVAFPRRMFYFLVIAVIVGVGTGILTYSTKPIPAGAIAAGILAAFGTLGWLQAVDWAALVGWHGFGLVVISVGFGMGMGALTYWGGAPPAGGALTGVPLAAAALLVLPKFVP